MIAEPHPVIHEHRDPPLADLPKTFANWARLPALGLIRLYQMTISLALPADTCRFYPTCSHYSYQAIYRYGVLKGGLMAAWRVLRCNPFNSGGYDPVPENKTTPTPMNFKKTIIILFLLLSTGLLSACSGGQFASTSWPGLTASEDHVYVASGNHVYALQAASGALIWRYPAAAERSVTFFAPPALAPDGQVIAGGFDHKLYSLDAQSGASNWVFEEATNHYIATPLVTGEGILAPNSDGNLYAVALTGKALWPAPYQTNQALWAAPAFDGDTLYLPGLNHQLFAIQAATGKVVWGPLDLDGAMVGTPALSQDGILYVGTFENELRALRASSGEAVWQAPFKTKDWVWAGPALAANTLYFGDLSGALYAVDRETGQARWQSETGSPIVGTPLFANDTLYVGNAAGTLLAFNLDGSLKWSKTIGGKIYSNPVFAAGNIIVGMIESENLLTAVDPNGDIQWSFIPPK